MAPSAPAARLAPVLWGGAAGVVADDEPVEHGRGVGVALAPLAEECPLRAGALTGRAAADGVLRFARAVKVAAANETGIDLGESADAVLPAAAPAARLEYIAVSIDGARFGAAAVLAALIAGQAVDDGLGAEPVDAGVGDTGIVLLAATVVIGLARPHARAVRTGEVLRAATRARLL